MLHASVKKILFAWLQEKDAAFFNCFQGYKEKMPLFSTVFSSSWKINQKTFSFFTIFISKIYQSYSFHKLHNFLLLFPIQLIVILNLLVVQIDDVAK